MRRFWDGWWTGILGGGIALLVIILVLGWTYSKGIEQGRSIERTDVNSSGYGRYSEMTIDDRHYSGWLR